MKVLITGACGWLSRRLIDELAARGHELRLLDYCAPEEATIFVPGSYERQRLPLQSKWPFDISRNTQHPTADVGRTSRSPSLSVII